MTKFVYSLYSAYEGCDASLFEINPVLRTCDDRILAVDSKVSLDDNSLFRHKEYAELRDLSEEDPTDVEADQAGLNFVNLDGNIGCMVNGAGLAMATMDIIKQSGGDPANFLDVGGTADADRVEKAFNIILKDSNVKGILVNIFGGIVRCDRVANGIVQAYKSIGNIPVPIIVRLQGTNAIEAKNIIDNSEHIALVKGVINKKDTILVRVHALDLLSDVLGDQSSHRTGSELSSAMETISNNKSGIIILIRDLSSESLSKKFSRNTNNSTRKLKSIRDYGVGAQILLDLGVKNMTILSNTKATAIGLDGFGLSIKSWKQVG